MMMRFVQLTVICLTLFSCTDNSAKLLTITFNSLADSSDKVSILPITTYYNGEDTGVTLTKFEVENLKKYLQQCETADSCGSANGQIIFEKGHNQIGQIAFISSPSCPVIYIKADGKLNSYRMSYRTGNMLNALFYKANKLH